MSRTPLSIIFTVCSIVLAACSNTASTQTLLEEQGQERGFGYVEEFLTATSDLSPVGLGEGEKLRVIATTNIVADVVRTIGGDAIELTALIPLGADPHTYQPTPRDYQAMADAHAIFINGLGLEESIHGTLEQVAEEVSIVSLSEGIEPRHVGVDENHEHEGESEASEHEVDLHPEGTDPHVWFDPTNVMQWVENIEQVLSDADPFNQQAYHERADTYLKRLRTLDNSIQRNIDALPDSRKKLVTDHVFLGYFAAEYGIEVVGTLLPNTSTSAETSIPVPTISPSPCRAWTSPRKNNAPGTSTGR